MQNFDKTSPEPDNRSCPQVTDIEQALSRILASPAFAASERRRAFLAYVIDETLAGRGQRLKGFSIALAVFDRDESFDPKIDPVVRLEARRLRRDLDGYYAHEGYNDPVRISIPKGGYVPAFEWSAATLNVDPASSEPDEPPPVPIDPADGGPPRFNMRHRLAAACLAIVAAGLVGWLAVQNLPPEPGSGRNEPNVMVMPFEALGDTPHDLFLARGITQELIEELMRIPGFRVYSVPGGIRSGGTSGHDPPALAEADYVITGGVRIEGDMVRLTAQVGVAQTGHVLWSHGYKRPFTPEALIEAQSGLAGEIATEIGQSYGVINHDVLARAAQGEVSDMQSYLCVLRAYTYRRNFSRSEFGEVFECLEEAVERDPGYSDAWAMLGWMHLDAGRFGFVPIENMQDAYQAGLSAATQAVELEPENVLAMRVLAAVNHYLKHFSEGEALSRKAVALNPHDPDTLAQLGWRLALRGNFEEGVPILERAIERTANPPGWYFHLIAVDLIMKGEYEQMLALIDPKAAERSGFSQALIAISSAAVCDQDRADAALGCEPINRIP
ncbi:hypothetical protein KHP62_19615 [Rhodobacteraceae bacterium NNCM2]|nr:hypothetical protein [Coraliihabitans acroporae]